MNIKLPNARLLTKSLWKRLKAALFPKPRIIRVEYVEGDHVETIADDPPIHWGKIREQPKTDKFIDALHKVPINVVCKCGHPVKHHVRSSVDAYIICTHKGCDCSICEATFEMQSISSTREFDARWDPLLTDDNEYWMP